MDPEEIHRRDGEADGEREREREREREGEGEGEGEYIKKPYNCARVQLTCTRSLPCSASEPYYYNACMHVHERENDIMHVYYM